MFIPEVKWGKTNDRDECRKIARTLATEMARTYGGEVEKLTDIVDEILDTAFLLGRAYEMLQNYKITILTPVAVQAYLVISAKICDADIPKDAMPNLANAVFRCMPFWSSMRRIMDTVEDIFRNEDLKEGRNHGND